MASSWWGGGGVVLSSGAYKKSPGQYDKSLTRRIFYLWGWPVIRRALPQTQVKKAPHDLEYAETLGSGFSFRGTAAHLHWRAADYRLDGVGIHVVALLACWSKARSSSFNGWSAATSATSQRPQYAMPLCTNFLQPGDWHRGLIASAIAARVVE